MSSSISAFDDKLAWYENTNGDASAFGSQQIITSSIGYGSSIFSEDLDNDNDMDILVASLADDRILWFENTGDGTFLPEITLTDTADGANSVAAYDIDGDSDLDVIYTSGNNNQVAWQENLDGNANFGDLQIISNQSLGASYLRAGDIDEDGDLDIVVISSDSGQIEWFENIDGTGNFGPVQIVTDEAHLATSVDILSIIEGGYKEIVYTTDSEINIAWSQYVDMLSINDIELSNSIKIFPNPTDGILNLDSEYGITKIELYNLKGQYINSFEFINRLDQIDMSPYNDGIYILKISDSEGKSHNLKVLKK